MQTPNSHEDVKDILLKVRGGDPNVLRLRKDHEEVKRMLNKVYKADPSTVDAVYDKTNERLDAVVDVLDKLSEANSHKHALDKLTHKMLDTLVKNDVDHVTRIKRLESLVGDMALRITELEQINKMPEHRHQYEDKDELPY